MKSTKGITLVALIITIIVMLILVGVSVQIVINSGLIGKAKDAADRTRTAYDNEREVTIKIGDTTVSIDELFSKYANYTAEVNAPEVIPGMIPVEWDGSKWIKADKLTDDWYSYGTSADTKKWANAVTVKYNDGTKTRQYYTDAAAGTPIAEADILGMYVWIPRFSYKIVRGYHASNNGNSEVNSGFFDIQFIKGTGVGTDNIAYNSTTTENFTKFPNGYVLHPAFSVEGTELKGFWVAKFEASSSATTTAGNTLTTYGASSSKPTITIGTMGADEVTVRPNVTSWRNTTVTNMYNACRNMTESGNTHGLTTTADSHLMKDTEWGAVAYLTQSIYGNAQTSSDTGVWNNSYYEGDGKYGTRTGMVGTTRDDSTLDSIAAEALAAKIFYTYETENGVKGSTTGTIYGIYDMAGGAWEYTASYLSGVDYTETYKTYTIQKDQTEYFDSNSNVPQKHRTVYTATETKANQVTNTENYAVDANKVKYGNAVYEISLSGNGSTSWNDDDSKFINAFAPFVIRGGRYYSGSSAGLFAFNTNIGAEYSYVSFRPVLAASL